MKIEIKTLRKLLSDLLEEHAPGKLGGMFCICELCERTKNLMVELDASPEGFLVLEHGKEEIKVDWSEYPSEGIKADISKAIDRADHQRAEAKEASFYSGAGRDPKCPGSEEVPISKLSRSENRQKREEAGLEEEASGREFDAGPDN